LKYTKLTIAIMLTAIFFGYNKWLFSLGVFELFNDSQYSANGHEKVKNFNPEEETLYLPGMEDKEFFEAVNDFSILHKKGVREFIYLYLTTGREYIIRSMERSGYYFGIIEKIMKENPDIPEDIALLPLLESGFDPLAVSRSKAVGLWQFMQATSSHLGLKNNAWVDERRDIEKSTRAAIRHLRYLNKSLGSWDLALAAYNGGEGQIRRAIQKTGTNDIWELISSGVLSRETEEYVPRFAALILIYKNRRLFRIENELQINKAYPTNEICLDRQKSLKDISQYYAGGVELLKHLNPELKTGITPPPGEGYMLKVPADSFPAMLAKMMD